MTYLHTTLSLTTALLLVTACGETHPSSDVDAGASAPDAAEPLADAGPPSSACMDLCQARRDDPTSGGCPFETIPESGNCEDRCGEVSSMSAATREAFDMCVRTDPLCFQSIDQCVLTARYPTPVPIPTTMTADGFLDFEGRTVTVAIEAGSELFVREAIIRDGTFEVAFDEPLPAAWPPLAFGYVDSDGDGRCGRTADVTFSENLVQTGTFDAPSYAVHLDGPPDRELGFVCDRL